MATTLPASTDYTGASVTQGGKKTFIAAVRSFIADAFGTDSTHAAVHAAFRNYGVSLANNGLAASVAASALTIALKGADGNDPSATNPVLVGMRSATIGSGVVNLRNAAAALSLVVPSTATMGQSNGVAARLWVALIDNAGTLELAVINTQLGSGQLHSVSESGLISTTAVGTGSDSAGVWYSTSARSNVPFRLIGYIESTQATAGTWATTPSVIQPMGPGVRKPGDVVQYLRTASGTVATGTTQIPSDNTIPQITEGDQYLTQAITPTSEMNALHVDAKGHFASSTGSGVIAGLFQDATANALTAVLGATAAADAVVQLDIAHVMPAGTTSATTFRLRAGPTLASTLTFNGTATVQRFGGVINSFLSVCEVMA